MFEVKSNHLIEVIAGSKKGVSLMFLGRYTHFKSMFGNQAAYIVNNDSAPEDSEHVFLDYQTNAWDPAFVRDKLHGQEVLLVASDTDASIEQLCAVANFLLSEVKKLDVVVEHAIPTDAVYVTGTRQPGRPWAGQLWRFAAMVADRGTSEAYQTVPFSLLRTTVTDGGEISFVRDGVDYRHAAFNAQLLKQLHQPIRMNEDYLVQFMSENGDPARWFPLRNTPDRLFDGSVIRPARYVSIAEHSYERLPETSVDIASGNPREDFLYPRLDPMQRVQACGAYYSPMATVFGRGGVLVQDTYVDAASIRESVQRRRALAKCAVKPSGDSCFVQSASIERVNGREKILLKSISTDNFGHMLVDLLPKLLGLIGKASKDSEILIAGGLPSAIAGHIEAAARIFGFTGRLVNLSDNHPCQVDRLWYFDPVARHPKVKNQIGLRALREVLSAHAAATVDPIDLQPSSGGKVILYSSRGGAKARRILNEAAFLASEQAETVNSLDLVGAYLAEQVAAFSACDVLIGSAGANLANMLFMRPGTTVIGLIPETMTDPFFKDLADCMELNYVSLIAASDTSKGQNVDFELQIDRTWSLFKRFL